MALKVTRPKPATAVPQELVRRVEALALTPTDHRPLLALFGPEASDQVRAAAPVAGRLLEVAVPDAERVEAGPARPYGPPRPGTAPAPRQSRCVEGTAQART
jgi:hypothetical protein